MSETMRIQRALARAGVLSRRKAEELVANGRVTVNGAPAQVGQTVDPERDVIKVDGERIGAPSPTEWFVLNKPAGVITSRHDPEGRRTVFDLAPARPGLTYVGRLDFLTEGVLLLTTDGAAAHRLTHPSHEVERTYVASVLGDGEMAVAQARHGVELEDGLVRPKRISAARTGRGRWELTITLSEGRNREVRRLCEALGVDVDRLVRVKFGPVELGDLAPGTVRSLTKAEKSALDKL
ncbi:MAG: rRNA pseudouridine synthase [Gemmatimonadota bacterium]|nr:rRNA pseudouridine synthase [Gemmatimonadota bacterium]